MGESSGGIYSNSEHFVADKEIIDQIRLAASEVPPQEQKEITEFVNAIKDVIVYEFGQHMSVDALRRIDSQPGRVIVLKDEDLATFRDAWMPNKTPDKSRSYGGSLYLFGNLIVVSDMRDQAKDFIDHHPEIFVTHPELKVDDVSAFIRFSVLTKSLVHEFIHSGQELSTVGSNMSLKESVCAIALDECGAQYLTDTMMVKRFPNASISTAFVGDHDQERSEKFGSILKIYGDNVYDVFFGNTPSDPEKKLVYESLKKNIYSEFNTDFLINAGLLKQEHAAAYERL